MSRSPGPDKGNSDPISPKEALQVLTSSVLGWGHLQREHTVFFTSHLGFLSISVILTSINKLRKTPLAFYLYVDRFYTSLETATSPLIQGSNKNDVFDCLSSVPSWICPSSGQVDTSVQKPSTAVIPQEGDRLSPEWARVISAWHLACLADTSEPRHPAKSPAMMTSDWAPLGCPSLCCSLLFTPAHPASHRSAEFDYRRRPAWSQLHSLDAGNKRQAWVKAFV